MSGVKFTGAMIFIFSSGLTILYIALHNTRLRVYAKTSVLMSSVSETTALSSYAISHAEGHPVRRIHPQIQSRPPHLMQRRDNSLRRIRNVCHPYSKFVIETYAAWSIHTGWEPLPNKHFRCRVCDETMHYRYLGTHETQNARHQRRLKYWTDPTPYTATDPPVQHTETTDAPSSLGSVPRSTVGKALFDLLRDFRTGRIEPEVNGQAQHASLRTPPSSGIDWSSSSFDNFAFDSSFAEQAVLGLAERFAEYGVNDGALDADSDDELQEDEGDRFDTSESVPGKHSMSLPQYRN